VKGKKSYTMLIADAVDESNLPLAAKALLNVMARHANRSTGVGWYGQESLAQWTGCSLRTVRDWLSRLSEPDSSPVRVERKARFRTDGRGRTSDQWTLILAEQPAGAAGCSGTTNRQKAPVTQGGLTGKRRTTNRQDLPVARPRLTGNQRATNRQPACDQPAGAAGDPNRDPVRDPKLQNPTLSAPGISTPIGPEKVATKKPKTKRPKPERTAEQSAAHKRTTEHYFVAFERKRGAKPAFDGGDAKAIERLLEKCRWDAGRACSVIDNALASWRGPNISIRQVASDPSQFVGAKPQARLGEGPRQPNHENDNFRLETVE